MDHPDKENIYGFEDGELKPTPSTLLRRERVKVVDNYGFWIVQHRGFDPRSAAARKP